jgi:hypothetical protein
MSYVTLPFRIRPSRARLGLLGGALAAVSVPIAFSDWTAWQQVLAALGEPSFSASFVAAVALCLFAAVYILFLVGFALIFLPGAPLLHVHVDERGVTYRRLWHVTRVSFRETGGWGYVERGLIPVSAQVRASTRLYTVVGGRGDFDGHLVSDDRRYAMDINVLPFTPLFESRESFAQDFAMCLTAAGRQARDVRRAGSIDVGPGIAEVAIPLKLPAAYAPRRAPARKAQAAR